MNISEITTIISNVGFPIACVVCLGWYAKDTTERIIKLTEKVSDALVSSTRAIDEIKDVISKLVDNN